MSSNKEKFSKLCQRAKSLSEEGNDKSIKKSLELYVEALNINPGNTKLIKKIEKIEVFYRN